MNTLGLTRLTSHWQGVSQQCPWQVTISRMISKPCLTFFLRGPLLAGMDSDTE